MKKTGLLLILFLGALALAMLLGSNEGYVLLVQHPYRIELSLNLFIILPNVIPKIVGLNAF